MIVRYRRKKLQAGRGTGCRGTGVRDTGRKKYMLKSYIHGKGKQVKQVNAGRWRGCKGTGKEWDSLKINRRVEEHVKRCSARKSDS